MNKLLAPLIICLFTVSCGVIGTSERDYIPVKGAQNYGFIDNEGREQIPQRYSRAACFSGGLAVVAMPDSQHLLGYIDVNGNFAIKPSFVYASSFSEGLAFAVRPGGVPEAIDKNGITRFSLSPAQSVENFSQGLAAYSILGPQGEVWGFVDKQGSTHIKPVWYATSYFSENVCAVMDGSGRWGYINRSGDIVIPAQFDNAFPFQQGRAKVVAHGRVGVINKDGHFLLQPAYEDVDIDGSRYLVKSGNKWGWLTQDGNILISLQFADAYPFQASNLAPVKVGEKWGFITSIGKFIIAPQYDYAFAFVHGVAEVVKDDKTGFIAQDGSYVASPVYTAVASDYYFRYFTGTSSWSGVSTDIATPSAVAYKWLNAFYHMDMDEALRFSTDDTKMLIDRFDQFAEMISDSTRRHMEGIVIGIHDEKISGNRAIVTYTLSDNRAHEQLLFLIRTDDKWKVQFTKNNLEEEQTEPIEE